MPRTACWAALIVALLNLVTEIFGADQKAPDPAGAHGLASEGPELAPAIVIRRAAEFFGWQAGLVVMASLIGFIPAIGVFVFLYMGTGFREPAWKAAMFGAVMALFCWGVFDRGLRVPWPLAVLGDLVPALRDSSGLM